MKSIVAAMAVEFLREKGLEFVPEPPDKPERRLPPKSFARMKGGGFIFSIDGETHCALMPRYEYDVEEMRHFLRSAWERLLFEMERKKRSPHE